MGAANYNMTPRRSFIITLHRIYRRLKYPCYLKVLQGLNFSLPPKKLKFEKYLLRFELLYKDVLHYERDINESLIHLKSKIKDVGLSSFRFYNKKDRWFENSS